MRMKDERKRFVPFAIEFVSCDESKKTGGELVRYDKVTLPQRERVELETSQRAKPADVHRKTSLLFQVGPETFRQCDIWLITKFNGENVI